MSIPDESLRSTAPHSQDIAKDHPANYTNTIKRSNPTTSPTSAPNSRKRGLVESTLLKIAKKAGYSITEVSPEKMAQAKGRSRARDTRRMATGKATPAQIQAKNDMLPGKIEVLDWSPIFA